MKNINAPETNEIENQDYVAQEIQLTFQLLNLI